MPLLFSAVLLAGCNDDPRPEGAPPPTGPGLTAVDFAFEPSEIAVTGGAQVTIRVANTGGVVHNLSIPDIEADIDYRPGTSDVLIFVAPASPSGRIEFFCKYHRDRGMAGAFTLQ